MPCVTERPVNSAPMLLGRRMSRATRTTEFVDRVSVASSSGLMSMALIEAPGASRGHRREWDDARAVQADAAAVEHHRRVAAAGGRRDAAEGERVAVLEEEIALRGRTG